MFSVVLLAQTAVKGPATVPAFTKVLPPPGDFSSTPMPLLPVVVSIGSLKTITKPLTGLVRTAFVGSGVMDVTEGGVASTIVVKLPVFASIVGPPAVACAPAVIFQV